MKKNYVLAAFASMFSLFAFAQNPGKQPPQIKSSIISESGSGQINYINDDAGGSSKTKTDCSPVLPTLEIPEVWFPFDGDFQDYSGNNYHGTNMNTTWTTDRYGNPGKALAFNGSNSGVKLNNGYPPVFNGSLTFSCWVYFNDDSRGILFGSFNTDHNVNFEKHTDFRLRIYWNNNERDLYTATGVVSAGSWYFVTFIRDVSAGSFRICVNGQEVETYSGTGSNITPAGPFYVGRDSRTGTTVLNGKMDDVRIYGRALSDTEVLALYNETDLVADFTAETTSGATPLTVNFTDASVLNLAPIAEWKWYFGDGDSSSVQNPVHIYEHSGLDVQTYTVILKVKDENGFVSQMTKEDYIKVFPENYITGGNVSGTWTAADSPYFIGGEIIVPFGDTLTIEPGVCVKFRTNSIDYSVQEPTPDNSDFGYMTVYGTLIARGTGADTIVFTRAGNTGWWGMIHLTNTANPDNPIEYCKMEYASFMILDSENNDEIAGLSFDGMDGTVQNSSFYNNVIGIRCNSSNTEITNCRILNNTEHGIQCAYDTTLISGNTISGNGVHGIDCNQSYSTIMGNEIIDNTESGIYCYESDSIIVSGNTISGGLFGIWYHFSSGQIRNNAISLSSAYGIICYENSDPQIDNNIISNIDIAGIACGNDSDPQIDDNIISDINYYGIVCSNDSDPHVRNTFIRNTLYYCIYCMGSTNPEVINTTMVGTGGFVDCSPNSTCTIENSILWDFNNVATSGSGISITWSCVQGGYIGTGNISTNPMFTGTGEMPYALSWTNFPQNDATKSPCIDTGDPDPNGNGNDWLTDPDDRDPDQSRMDMGARYYHQEPAKELLNPNGVHQSFNFGPWDIGMISDYETFTITNKTACFTDCPVYLNKGGNSQFKMENLADTLLHFNPNETKNIGVAFLPTLTGPQYDTLNAGETGQFHDALRLIGTGQGTGNAEGIVLTSAGEGVPSVTITVTGGNIPSTHTTTTMADGSYYIANIGWGVFTITPSKYEDTIPHVFFPVHRTGTTSYPTYPTIENADFQDNSYFSVSGHIGYMNTTCPVEGVHILMDDEIEAVTDATGNFVIGSVEIGSHTFKPDTAGGHRFYPEQILDTILSPLAGMQFTDSLTYKLSGYVAGGGIPLPDSPGGGCSVPLADSMQLVVECMNSCGSAAVIYTDTLGYYSINLAPGQYEITPSPVVYNGTPITFDTRQMDLGEGPVSGNFIYHTDPEIMISGFDTLPEFNGLKILEQFEIYNIAINIYEPYGDVQCPVTSGTVTVTDNLSDEGGEVDVPVSDSGAYYTFMAGYPNIYEPYKKDIRFEYENESGKIASFQQWVYIMGQVPRETAFATTMPQIPLLILRDPPGDGSFSYMNNTTSVSNSYSFGTKHQDDTSAFVKASLCLKFKVKFLFGIKLDIEEKFSFKAGIEQSVRQNSITENQSTLTTSTTYKTSSDELIVGSGGDVYMGGAMNLLYGITDILSISGDSISVDQDIIFAPNGFATKYIYTEYQILNDIIPDLYRIEDFASAHRWENIIAYNQSLKDNAAPYMGNQSVSYGTTMQFFETMSRSRTHTEEFELMINKNMAAEIGLKINGLGLGEGAAVSSSITYGSSEVNSALNSTTVGFDVSDNDPLDIITYDIKTDRVYGTPVFETVSGETSCPYEEVTVPRQGCLLTIEPNVMWNVPAGEAALFEENMINTSQTEEDLVPCILQSSNNPYGVNIKHETSLSLGKQFNLDYGSNVIYISVSMPEGGQIYDYEGLTLRLSPKCEKEIAEALGVVPNLSDAVTFDVHFDPPCSPISIQSPNNNWVVNQASNNILPVTITGYDTLNPDLHSVGLEYYSGGYWNEAFSILKESIQSPILNVDLDMSGFPDGECKIRAVVTCEGGEENYSENRTGIIDRISPMISGNPQPLDGILNIGDEIFFTFNEKLDVSSVTINSCKILDTYSGLTAGSSVQYITQGNKVLLTLNPENMYFLEGLLLKSQIAGVKDIYGNPLADTATWTFLVDQGPLHWSENNFVFIIEDGDSISFNSTLENVSSNDIFSLVSIKIR